MSTPPGQAAQELDAELTKLLEWNNHTLPYDEQLTKAKTDILKFNYRQTLALIGEDEPEIGLERQWKNELRAEQRQGTAKGFPDYVIALPGVGVVYIELKRLRGSATSQEQRQWVDTLNSCPGAEAHICKGAQAAIAIVEELWPSTLPLPAAVVAGDVF